MGHGANAGLQFAKVAGIPLVIAPSAAISAFLIFWALGAHVCPVAGATPGWPVWAMAAAGTVVFFGSLLAHELAHSLVARQAGLTVRRIVLFVFGGVSESVEEMPGAGVELRVAVAGPLTSVLLSGAFLGLARLMAIPRPLAARGQPGAAWSREHDTRLARPLPLEMACPCRPDTRTSEAASWKKLFRKWAYPYISGY